MGLFVVNTALAVDPGNKYTGLACAVQDSLEGPQLVDIRGVTMIAGDVERSVRERIRPWIDRYGPSTTEHAVLWFEEPPDFSRSDVHHGSEAKIGYAEGWLSGLIAGGAMLPVRRTTVSDWRSSMLTYCGRNGLFMDAPKRKNAPSAPASVAQRCDLTGRPEGGFTRTWRGCQHIQNFPSFAALKACADTVCPMCRADAASKVDPADWVRDEWKRLACLGIARFWPDLYTSLVGPARERARTEKPDHQLAGVADGCEAGWIAMYGLQQAKET